MHAGRDEPQVEARAFHADPDQRVMTRRSDALS